MTWEPRPTPDVSPETARFWQAATEGTLLLSNCRSCGLVYYYPRALCPDCLSDDVDWIAAEGTGEIYSYSTMEYVDGWPEEDLPLVIAFVELKEGPRVMTNVVDCDPDDLGVGTRVGVRFVPTEDESVAIPVFTPAE